MKTAIYIRTSTHDQEPENQIKNILELFSGDYELFKDHQSAWQDHKERKEFQRLKDLIKKKEFSDLYVWDLDRIFRDRKKLIEFFEYCKLYKVKIHSYRQTWLEEINSMPEPWNEIIHNLMLQIMGWIAEEESSKKSQRIRNAIVKNKDGTTKSYKGNSWGRKSYPKQTIKRVLDLYNQGMSYRSIQKNVSYYDKNRNEKQISLGGVHKIVRENLGENSS